MSNANKFSTQTIFTLLAFVCAAIMMSLFIFHLTHKPAPIKAASDNSLLFPVPRDIKEFSLVTSKEQPFTQQDLKHHWTLLFFGFTHCPNVCPTTLSMLSKAYEQLHNTYPDLRIVLVSLDPERDNTKALAEYTANFNPDIIGVSGKIQELRKLQSQLGIYSERNDEDNGTYTLQHTSSIMLINPQGQWVGMFKFGMNPAEFVAEFKTDMQQLTNKA